MRQEKKVYWKYKIVHAMRHVPDTVQQESRVREYWTAYKRKQHPSA